MATIQVVTDYDLDTLSPYAYGDNQTIRQMLRRDFIAYNETHSYYTIDGPCQDQIDFLEPFVEAGVLGYVRSTNDEGYPANLYSLAVPLDQALAAIDAAEMEG